MSRPVRYRGLLWLAGAAILWERLWRRLWPAALVAGTFLAVALLDVLPLLPGWLHALALLAFAAALGTAVTRGAGGAWRVEAATARHRLEQDSGLAHRPLTALEDRLAGDTGDATARSLWRTHLQRMAAAARNLRVGAPSPGLAWRDPYGLRAAVLLFLVIALAAGRGDAAERLERALIPQFGAGLSGPLTLEAWITPPAYTGRPPMFLDRTSEGTVEVPAGSTLLAQVSGTRGAPQLAVGTRTVTFTAIGDGGSGGHRVETVIEDGDRLAVELDGRVLDAWPLRVVPDGAPEVAFAAPPARTGGSRLRLEYEASDDYGLSGIAAVIRRPDDRPAPAGELEIRLSLPVPGQASKSVRATSIHDLTAHPWAGLLVRLHLEATDGRDQTGTSGIIELALPERIFNHPVARAIIEQRKKLVTPTKAVRAEVISALNAIAARPRHFFDDIVVYLALSVAQARLVHDDSDAAAAAVQKLLWDTALRIEDGDLSIAERDLRQIQERLMEALQDNKAPEEIERLMDELQRALDKYLAALAEHMKRLGTPDMPPQPGERTLGSDELQRMIQEARELARTGARDAAQRLLAEVQRMLDSIRGSLEAGNKSQDAAKARRLMDGLRDLTKKQQELLDRSFRRQRQQQQRQDQGAMPRPGGEQDPSGARQLGQGGEDAARQEGLRRGLGGLMLELDEFMGGIPDPLGKAERAMRDATDALTLERPGDAVTAQGEALEQLRQATESVGERLARRLGGLRMGAGRPSGGRGRDPFGRRPGGAFGAAIDGDIDIPDQMEMRRAREILHELRRRAGEHQRPKIERNYIDRLLRQF
jgi:uncharacterized protein (TIGR02302 family)